MKVFSLVVLGLVAVWLLGDLIYSALVARQLQRWEAGVERDSSGVQQGCQAYTIGSGADAVLLVHGINDSPRTYYKMAPALAEQGLTCRVMRLPGFGEPLPRYARAAWQDWVTAIDGEVRALRQEHSRVAIVAHSLGGAATIAYLLDRPGDVDAVVLLAPAVEVSNERSPVLPTRAWHEFARRTFVFTNLLYSPFENHAHDPSERDYPGRVVFTPLAIVDQTFAMIDHNRGRAGELEMPLMMVLTKDDPVIDWRAAERYYGQALSERKQLRFMENSGHMIPVDYGWDTLSEEIAQFVKDAGRSGELQEQE